MAIKYANNVSTSISSSISSDTSINVDDTSKFPYVSNIHDYCYATITDGTNNEIIRVTNISGNTLTVQRGQDNTTIQNWNAGATIELRVCSALLDDINLSIGTTKNKLIVDSNLIEVTGQVYNSYSDALNYALSTTPSATNKWTIHITGECSDNITLHEFIGIQGQRENTRLTGTISTTSVYGSAANPGYIADCEIINLSYTTNMQMIALINCNINASISTTGNTAILFAQDCVFSGGNYAINNLAFKMVGGEIKSGTFPINPNPQFENINISDTATCTINGGSFINCFIQRANSATYNSGYYLFRNGILGQPITNTGIDDITIIGTQLLSPVQFATDSGTLSTEGITGLLSFTTNSGQWANKGISYDNSTSGLSATNTQDAIDELASNIPGQCFLEITSSSYQTLSNSLNPDIIFNNIVHDNSNIYNTSNGHITIPNDGKYNIVARLMTNADTISAGSTCRISIAVNGSRIYYGDFITVDANQNRTLCVSGNWILNLTANDVVTIRIRQDTGTSLSLNGDTNSNYCMLYEI